jgi:hypothetical protein
MHPFKEPEA